MQDRGTTGVNPDGAAHYVAAESEIIITQEGDMTGIRLLAALLAASAATASAQTTDNAPVALRSAEQLEHDRGEAWTYIRPDLDLSAYRNVMIEPTVVYTGPDAQFGDISRDDRARFAAIVTEHLREEVGQAIPLVERASAGTARLRITVLGMTETTGGVATATRVTPMGFASNAVNTLIGREGRFTGSMLLALELYDGGTGELQAAAVRRRAPDAIDIPATISTTETVQSIARELAKNLRQRFETGSVRPPPR